MQETHLKETGQLDEKSSGYTYMWSGCENSGENYHGVAICARTELIRKQIISEPICYSDRIMSVQIKQEKEETVFFSVYAPTLTDDILTIETFYQDLEKIIEKIPKSYGLIIAGDFNARVGTSNLQWRDVMGSHGTGSLNANGLRLLQLCSITKMRIINTCFQLKDKHKNTWQHPRSKKWFQIDYILIRSREMQNVLRCRVMRGAHCETDHHLIRAAINIKLRKYFPKRKNVRPMYDIGKLKYDEIQTEYEDKLKSSYCERNVESVEESWKAIKEAYVLAASTTLGIKQAKREDWFDESEPEISVALEKKRTAYNTFLNNPSKKNKGKYKIMRQATQKAIRRARENWWIARTNEMQGYMDRNDSYNLHKCINSIVGPIKKSLNVIDDANGQKLKQKTDRLNRWNEYFKEVYNQDHSVNISSLHLNPVIVDHLPNDEPPEENEIKTAIEQLKNWKSPGEDCIFAEMIKGGKEESVYMLKALFSKIWESEQVPQEWCKALVIPLHKKGSKTKCDNYRGISLLSVPGKVLSRIIYNRLSPFIESQLQDHQSGFRKDHSTNDMIFSTRQMVEKSLEQNSPLCIAFVDISKAFDSVNRNLLFKILERLNCPLKLLQILKSLHESTSASVYIEGEATKSFEVKTGVKQGCVLAPMLFLLYMHAITDNVSNANIGGVDIRFRSDSNMFDRRGLKAKNKVKTNRIDQLLFADDCALFAKTPAELQTILDVFVKSAKEFGLQVNEQKTEVMFINCPPSNITINSNVIKTVSNFKYLGSIISQNADINTEVKHRINAASQAFGRLYVKVWKPHNLSMKTKLLIYKTVVLSTLLYSSECWTALKRHTRELNAFHLKCLRSILNISWKDKIPNEEILRRTGLLSVDEMLRLRRLKWTGHLSRMSVTRIPHQVAFSELVEGFRLQQKPKKRWKDTIKDDLKLLGIKIHSWRSIAENRTDWRTLLYDKISNVHEIEIEEAAARRVRNHKEEEKFDWKCPLCNFRRSGKTGRQYVQSHITQNHKDQIPRTSTSLECCFCNHISKTKAGLSSHIRHKHAREQNTFTAPRPLKLISSRTDNSSSFQSTISLTARPRNSQNLMCPVCGRICRTRAGLSSHLRNPLCRSLITNSSKNTQTTSHR